MTYSMTRLMTITVLLMLMSLPLASTYLSTGLDADNVEDTIDPAPLCIMLRDVLMFIISNDYGNARSLINKALSIELPLDILNTHRKLYAMLNDLVNNLEFAQNIINGSALYNTSSTKVVKDTYIGIYEIKLDLKDNINEYTRLLRRFFIDPTLRFMLIRDIDTRVFLLNKKLDEVLNELEEIYRNIKSRVGIIWLNISIELPEKVRANTTVETRIFVAGPLDLTGISINATLISIYGETYYRKKSITLTVNEEAIIPLNIPGVEELIKNNVEITSIGRGVSLRVIVKAKAHVNNTMLVGMTVRNSRVALTRPTLRFIVPSYTYVGETLRVNVTALIDYPLNVSVYIDKVSPENNLLNVTITPETKVILIPLNNVSAGYHTIIFVSEAKGYYISIRTSSAIAILLRSIDTVIEVPNIVVGPPFTITIKGFIQDRITYDLIVKVDEIVLYNDTLDNETIYIVSSLPFTPLMWVYTVNVTIIPLAREYGPVSYVFNVHLINVLVPVFLTLSTGLALTLPTTTNYVQLMVTSLFTRIRGRGTSRKIIVSMSKHSGLTITFRKSLLKRLYKKLVSMLSVIVDQPREYETLREYLRRVKERVNKIVFPLIREFIYMFEKDLYSTHRVDTSKASRIIDEIAKRMGKHES